MEIAATKLIESATIKTLHAHSFSRSSTQATLVLTDLLARYLTLLTETCAKYAHHAGRSGLTVYDVLSALDDMGVSIDELHEYCSADAKELNRYAFHSNRRMEDLNEFKAQLSVGMKQDRDDVIPLEFQQFSSPPDSDYESDEDMEMEVGDRPTALATADTEDYTMIVDSQIVRSPSPLERKTPPPRPSAPPLPLSPISNPSSPSRKRPRTANWKPPSYVPDFLPPFPSTTEEPVPSVPASHHDSPSTEAHPSHPVLVTEPQAEKTPVAVAQTLTSSAASDYLVQVPYSQSSLSSISEWHLPTQPPNYNRPQPKKNTLPTLQTEPALFKAYHHILTSRSPPTPPPSNLSRHKVSMAFLAQTQNPPRWDVPDTLFSNIAPCPPRVAVIGPSYPVPISDARSGKGENKEKDVRFPPTIPRPVSTVERLTPLVGQPTSRIPDLARHVLPPVIINRTTRLAHPPVLHRGNKPLLYGPGIPAPWNSHSTLANDATNPTTPLASKDKEREGETEKPLVPDARLYATWDYEPKDFKIPLPPSRHRNRMGSLHSTSSGVISLPGGGSSRAKSSLKNG